MFYEHGAMFLTTPLCGQIVNLVGQKAKPKVTGALLAFFLNLLYDVRVDTI